MGHNRQQAFRAFIASVEGELIASVWRILRDGDDTDDAYQQTLVKLWKRFPKVMHHRNPRALALSIAMNTALDSYRKRARSRTVPLAHAPEGSLQNVAPFADTDAHDTWRDIMDAIAALSGKQAEAAMMRFVHDCPYPEIAAALGCSEATARKHIQRAREKLTKQLAYLIDSNGGAR